MNDNEELSQNDAGFAMHAHTSSGGSLQLAITPKRELSEEEKYQAQLRCLTVATIYLDRKGWLKRELPAHLEENESVLRTYWASLIKQKKVIFDEGKRGIMRIKIESVSDYF